MPQVEQKQRLQQLAQEELESQMYGTLPKVQLAAHSGFMENTSKFG